MRVSFLLLSALLLACPAPLPSHEAQLRALHAKVLRAHLQSDVGLLLEDDAPQGTQAQRGVVSTTGSADTRAHLGPYLARTTFTEYRDLIEPVVAVSRDGTLGWVIVQVYARGTQRQDDGTVEPLEFTCAWIELYRRQDDRWLRVGNVSSFKE
jgi:hypothetical protein